jgi:protein disulfide-isomerase
MKKFIAIVTTALLVHGAYAIEWGTDMKAALKQAKEADKLILASFSGSDWCGWCIKLDKEVFHTDAFNDFASKTFVLFQADYPMKSKQPKELKQQNEALAEKYQVRGFPTVLLLNGDGAVVAQTGYQRGGPEAYIKHLKELIEKK